MAPVGKRPAKPAATSKGSDDPFEMENTAAATAIPLSPTQTKSRSLLVTCPMCETKGYSQPSAVGKDVKCSNPKCLVPVFTVPLPKVEPPPPPPPPAPVHQNPMVVWAATGVAVVALGGYAWYMFAPKPAPKGITPDLFSPAVPVTLPGTPPADAPPTDATPVAPPTVPKVVDQRDQLLHSMLNAVQESKTYRAAVRRWMVTAYADAQQPVKAREQLQILLTNTEQGSEDDTIVPLVHLAWLAPRGSSEAKADLETAKSRVPSLEKQGRYRTTAVLELAALMAAEGQPAEAHALLTQGSAAPPMNALSAALMISRVQNTFTLDREFPGRQVGTWEHPLEVAVTVELAARGLWDQAEAWAKSAPNASARSEGLAVWAELFAAHALASKPALPVEKITAAAATLAPAEKSLLLVRLAAQQFKAGDAAAATATVQSAVQTLEGLAPPKPVALGNLKEMLEWKAPEFAPLITASVAAGEIGRVFGELKQPEPAWKAIQLGLAFLQGAAPSTAKVAELRDRAKLLSAVKDDFRIRNDDTARQSQSKSRNQAETLGGIAATRFRHEQALLRAAMEGGLLDAVQSEMETKSNESDSNLFVPYLSTGLPLLLANRYNSASQPDKAAAIQAKAGPADVLNAGVAENARLLADAGKIGEAMKEYYNYTQPDGSLHEDYLRLICRLVTQKRFPDAMIVISAQQDPNLQFEAVRLAASVAAKQGTQEEFMSLALNRLKANAANIVAVYYGTLEGYVPPQPAVATVTAPK